MTTPSQRTFRKRLALLGTAALALALPVRAADTIYPDRDNTVEGDAGAGIYRVPYHKPTVEEVKAAIDRVFTYVNAASPTRVIDEATGREITDRTQVLPTAIADRGDGGAFNPWQYTMGVTHAGMMRVADVTGDTRYADFVRRHMQFIHDWLPYFRRQAELTGIEPGAEHRGHGVRHNSFRGAIATESLDDSGAIGAALIKARMAGIGPDNTALVDHLVDWVARRQFRLDDGSWARRRPQPVSLWADDYYMSVPLMAQMTRLSGDRAYIDDAARHVLRASSRLCNPRTQLFTHGWNANQPYNPQFYWARANGWVAMAIVELLDVMPTDHPDRAAILDLFQQHIQALASLQGPRGLWRNLLDKTDSFEETSSTAMFVYAIAHAINEGWISPASFGSVAQVGWNGLAMHITPEGHVDATCVGTTFASDNVYYYSRPTTRDGNHSIGPVLMAGAEMIRLLQNPKIEIRYQWRTNHYIPR